MPQVLASSTPEPSQQPRPVCSSDSNICQIANACTSLCARGLSNWHAAAGRHCHDARARCAVPQQSGQPGFCTICRAVSRRQPSGSRQGLSLATATCSKQCVVLMYRQGRRHARVARRTNGDVAEVSCCLCRYQSAVCIDTQKPEVSVSWVLVNVSDSIKRAFRGQRSRAAERSAEHTSRKALKTTCNIRPETAPILLCPVLKHRVAILSTSEHPLNRFHGGHLDYGVRSDGPNSLANTRCLKNEHSAA